MNEYNNRDIVTCYAKKREWAEAVPETIMHELRKSCNMPVEENIPFQKMVDAGCGSGRSTRIFAPYFHSVVGFDISLEQIQMAQESEQNDNVTYVTGTEDNFPCENESVDLVASSFAIHYMDTEKFVAECKRVLKPNGIVAAYGLAVLDLILDDCNENISLSGMDIYNEYYLKPLTEFVHELNHPQKHAIDKYQSIYDSITGMKKWRNDIVEFDNTCTLNDLKSQFQCIPIFRKFHESFSESPIDILCKKLKELWKMKEENDADVKIKLTFSVFIVFLKQLP
ncbi:putative methyltransferase DDB_G0268948 [Styela clava]